VCVCVMPVILYGCEACSVTLLEERMLKIFGNRTLRKIFGCESSECNWILEETA
jgi:hypothetical protein